ncbi:hypothetical protein ACFY7C_36225 [Streptomyces sp. NPDC012769]|uniref:hypothetical protein n=1 Tax=Streptomyces sp. NPDC012769 TaxID=3364848 RepID=UPI0036A4E4A4
MDDLKLLFDPSAPIDGTVRLDIPAGLTLEDAASALEALLAAEAVEYVLVVVDGRPVGVTSRRWLIRIGAASMRSLGDGAGATLPGESLRYRLLRYTCGMCNAEIRRVHVDPRDPPTCPNGHGVLELTR